MIAAGYDELKVGGGNENGSNTKKVTEIYSTRIPKLACFKRAFVRDIVEMDFAEDFEVEEYNPEKEVGKRKMCCYRGHFVFAPEIEVSIYEAKNFARVYLKYGFLVEEAEVEEVRQRLISDGLERRLMNKAP